MIKIPSYHFKFYQKILALCLWVFLALGTTKATAQFAITEDFRGSGNADIIIGNDAYLTSGVIDPVNAGWLRLTNDEGNKKGYAYVNKSFPSTMGVLVDFEYKMWRDTEDAQNGADGIGIFLFDGSTPTFTLGGYGGSLGYARNTTAPAVNNGLAGGYVGIGLDAYGNFGNDSEGKYGRVPSTTGEVPNAVIMRGPTTTNTSGAGGTPLPTNRYLASKVLGSRTGNATDIRGRNEIDYNTVTGTRPTDTDFYRRVQIEIVRLDEAGIYYSITVRWKKTPGSDFEDLMNYTTTDVPPALLKLGFAASTGGSINNHEIRNLLVTTPGNLRVVKRADKDFLRLNNLTNKTITYTVEVTNDTDLEVSGITFSDKITDAYGDNLIEGTDFNIESITPSGFVSTALPDAATLTSNEITGTLTLGARKTGRITIVATLLRIPPGNVLANTATANPVFDEDRNNNTSTVRTPVVSENIDLIVTKTVTEGCINASTPATFTAYVSNIGALSTVYNRLGTPGTRVAIYNTVPAGYIYTDVTPSGLIGTETNPQNSTTGPKWSMTSVVNPDGSTTYRYIARGNNSTGATETLNSGATYPYPIKYTVKPPVGVTTFTDISTAKLFTDLNYNSSIETATNQLNNNSSITMNVMPGLPTVNVPTVYYCKDATAVPLSATATGTNKLRWYTTQTGFSSDYPITPSTVFGGTYTYYVSQVNGECEGDKASITVVVFAPTAGSITGTGIICPGTSSTGVDNSTPGTKGSGVTAGTLSYRWEKATDVNGPWTTIAGEESADLSTTGNLNQATYFRRYTRVTVGSTICESEATAHVTLSFIDPGSISGSYTDCTNGNINAPEFVSESAGTTTPGTYRYRWERSTDGLDWDPIDNADDDVYNPPQTSAVVTYFRRGKRRTTCSDYVYTNVLIVRKVSNPTSGNLAPQTICYNTVPAPITTGTTAPTGAGTFEWWYSSNGTSGWTTIAETGETYTPTAALTSSRYYRRRTVNDCGNSGYTIVKVAVQSVPAAGTIGGTQTICYNTPAATITSSTGGSGSILGTPADANPVVITYRWEQATGTTGGSYTTIPGATSATYAPGTLTTSMRYRRYTIATHGGTSCESVATDPITVTVKNVTDPKTIGPLTQTFCSGGSPVVLTGVPGAGDGAITYQWQYSINGISGWNNVATGGTGINYTPPSVTMFYRRGTIAGGTCTAYTDPVAVTVRNCKIITNPMIYQKVN